MTHTSTEQPEALRIAERLTLQLCMRNNGEIEGAVGDAIKELRRLHARVQELEASQAQGMPLSGLLARIKKEIDHAVINDHRTTPAFGRLKGEPCVKVAHLEATIDGWHMEYGITQEKQG